MRCVYLHDDVCRYEEFHGAVLAEVGVWSTGVERCVTEYDTALCQYLGVGRAPPTTASGNKVSIILLCV